MSKLCFPAHFRLKSNKNPYIATCDNCGRRIMRNIIMSKIKSQTTFIRCLSPNCILEEHLIEPIPEGVIIMMEEFDEKT